jgi:hypothetical protein
LRGPCRDATPGCWTTPASISCANSQRPPRWVCLPPASEFASFLGGIGPRIRRPPFRQQPSFRLKVKADLRTLRSILRRASTSENHSIKNVSRRILLFKLPGPRMLPQTAYRLHSANRRQAVCKRSFGPHVRLESI